MPIHKIYEGTLNSYARCPQLSPEGSLIITFKICQLDIQMVTSRKNGLLTIPEIFFMVSSNLFFAYIVNVSDCHFHNKIFFYCIDFLSLLLHFYNIKIDLYY